MTGVSADLTADPIEHYVARLREHFARHQAGHDPLGHLFAIERLARAARSEAWTAAREPKSHGGPA